MTEHGWTPLHVRAINFYLEDSHLAHCSMPPVDPRPKSVLSFFRRELYRAYVIPQDSQGVVPCWLRVLISIGVCLSFCRTPFGYACSPGDLEEDGTLVYFITSNTRLKETIREFIKAGEDFADVIDDEILENLIFTERCENSDLSAVASRWLLNDILPTVNPMVMDRRIWEQCLRSILYSNSGHSLLPTILRRCDTSMTRTGIMWWILSHYFHGRPDDFR